MIDSRKHPITIGTYNSKAADDYHNGYHRVEVAAVKVSDTNGHGTRSA